MPWHKLVINVIEAWGFSKLNVKNIVGILIVIVLLFVVIFALSRGQTIKNLTLPFDGGGVELGQRVCSVNGTVYNSDTGRAMSNVDVGHIEPGRKASDEEHFKTLDTTGPDGTFQFNCTHIQNSEFPRVIALSNKKYWRSCIFVTNYEIKPDQDQPNINLYVPDSAQRLIGGISDDLLAQNCKEVL